MRGDLPRWVRALASTPGWSGRVLFVDEEAAKANLHDYLKHERQAVLAKLSGLSEYDVRRPLTITGTNLLGLVKHLAT